MLSGYRFISPSEPASIVVCCRPPPPHDSHARRAEWAYLTQPAQARCTHIYQTCP
ncbi:hypothetical protein C2E23DRAFT_115414 [Lenzites betulinus]|nr:hypothetical protein C2E23DRAFT_115414 [Lenzites betulinus]